MNMEIKSLDYTNLCSCCGLSISSLSPFVDVTMIGDDGHYTGIYICRGCVDSMVAKLEAFKENNEH